LNASDAYAVLARKYSTRQLSDGTVVTSLGRSAHMEARLLDDGVLFIDSTSVAKSLRGRGISHDLFEQTLSQVGRQNVRSVQSYLSNTNLDVVRSGMERGLSASQAAALTPRGRSAIKNGFTNIDYDPFTGIFTAR
jgi:predicted GNAT family acetyltransferase